MTRGRCGSLFLHRVTLSFTTPRRFNPAHGGRLTARHVQEGPRGSRAGSRRRRKSGTACRGWRLLLQLLDLPVHSDEKPSPLLGLLRFLDDIGPPLYELGRLLPDGEIGEALEKEDGQAGIQPGSALV